MEVKAILAVILLEVFFFFFVTCDKLGCDKKQPSMFLFWFVKEVHTNQPPSSQVLWPAVWNHYSAVTWMRSLTGFPPVNSPNCVSWKAQLNQMEVYICIRPCFLTFRVGWLVRYTFTPHIVHMHACTHTHTHAPWDHSNFLPAGCPRRLKNPSALASLQAPKVTDGGCEL